ncbi:MAG: D-alanine-D-alanine ligase [Verrucomicrobiales bacterium]|jgi:D-alanine-D-alanine ligase
MSISGKKIAVVMGGPGSEREVSLASGKGVHEALLSVGADVVDIDVTGDDFEVPDGVELCFNVIHGTFGEDGGLQRILNSRRMPYTGAGAASSELAFDKVLSKKAFIEHSVPTPAFEIIPTNDPAVTLQLPLPVVIKPPREGSSVGVHIVRETSEIGPAIEDCAKYDVVALVEQFVPGKELTVGILDGKALPIVQICPRSGFYDMKNKYPWLADGGGTDYFCPADLPDDVTEAVQAAAIEAHRAIGIEVYSRVDILLSEDNLPYVLEANTIPGMTESSLLPKGARAAGIEYPQLCEQIAELSMKIRNKPPQA